MNSFWTINKRKKPPPREGWETVGTLWELQHLSRWEKPVSTIVYILFYLQGRQELYSVLSLTCKVTTTHYQICCLWPFASKQMEQKEQQTRHHHGHLAFQPSFPAGPLQSAGPVPQAPRVTVDSIRLPKTMQHIKSTWRLLLHKSTFPTINKGDCTEYAIQHRSSPETVRILQGWGAGEHHCLHPLSTSTGWMGALPRHSNLPPRLWRHVPRHMHWAHFGPKQRE